MNWVDSHQPESITVATRLGSPWGVSGQPSKGWFKMMRSLITY